MGVAVQPEVTGLLSVGPWCNAATAAIINEMWTVTQWERRAVRRRVNAVSTAITDSDANVGSKVIQKSAEASTPVKARRAIWPILIIITASLASLVWTGFLAWAGGRIFGVL